MGVLMLMLMRLLTLVFMGVIMSVTSLVSAWLMCALFIAFPGRTIILLHNG